MAKQHPAYFAVMFGLDGCYMPDSDFGHYAVTTRAELTAIMREALAFYDFPESAFGQVRWRNVWHHVKRHGASSLHFSITHKGNAVQFAGLTEAEFEEREAANAY